MIRAACLGAALLAAAPAAADSVLALEGKGLRELAAHPDVSLPLRSAAQGRSGTVFERLNLPATPVAIAQDRFAWARSCAEACRDGLFLAFDASGERLYLLVVEAGRPVLVVPPFGTAWPAALREGVSPMLPR